MNNLKNKATWSEGDSSGGRRLLIEEFNLNFNSSLKELEDSLNVIRGLIEDFHNGGTKGGNQFDESFRSLSEQISTLNLSLSEASLELLPTFDQRRLSNSLSRIQDKLQDLRRSTERSKPIFSFNKSSHSSSQKDFSDAQVDKNSDHRHTKPQPEDSHQTVSSLATSPTAGKNFIRNIRNFVRSIQFDNSSSFSISDCSNSIIILNPVITNDSKDFKGTSTPLNHLKLFRTHNSILIISSSSSNLSLNVCLNPTKHPTRQDDHKILLNNFFCSDCHNLLMIFEKKPNQMRIHNSNDLTCLIRSIESDQDSLRNRTEDRSIVIENSGSIRIYSPPLQSNSEDSLENRNLKDDLMNNDGRSQGFLEDLMVYDFNNFSNLIREGMFKENVSRNKLTDVSPQGKQDTGIDQIGMKNYEMLGEDKRLELVQRFEPILGFLNGKEFKSCYSSQDNLTTEIPPSDGCGDEGVLIIPDHIISMLNDPSLFSI